MLSSLSVYNSYSKVFAQQVVDYCDAHEEIPNCQQEEGRRYAEGYCQENNCNNLYFERQVVNVFIGLLLGFLAFIIPMGVWRTLAPVFFVAAFLLLCLVFTSLGTGYGTSKSWLNIPLFRSVQPVEAAKLAMIFYFAIWMSKKQNTIQTFQGGFLPFVILVSVMIIPVAFQPDFGSVLVLGIIGVTMFFVAGGNIWHIIGGSIVATMLSWPIVFSHAYIRARFFALFMSDLALQDDKYQLDQSLMGIGSGGFFGVGLGNSTQRSGWLPEIQGDFIFSGIAEEMGFFRILLLLLVFIYIALKGFQIAKNAPDRFSFLVAVGVTSWIIFQAIINILVTLGLFPLTGITFPFLSYGGSSLVMFLFGIGLLLNISSLSPPVVSRETTKLKGKGVYA
ncbi:cell division protein FtsW [Candidatus Peregrinibacteria bacterium]|nr:cell division protein FtsW [Candidatus Peregrinibacteria bacterium]